MGWEPVDLTSDPDEPYYEGDPGELAVDGWQVLLEALRHPAWHRGAKCKGRTETMFAERGQSVEPARALCRGCPVTTECFDAGLHERSGIWAGLSERQRRAARRTAA